MRRFVLLSGLVFIGAWNFTASGPWSPGASALAAQEPLPDFELEGLVVTGTSVPRSVTEMGSHVTILEGDELRALGVTRVVEALRRVPGVAVARAGSFGAVSSLFMRGGESDFVQVLVDGVKVNEPGGSFDFSSLSMEHVERIEIVRGPSSALYGSDAVTGVIHIISRAGAEGARGSVRVMGGTFGTLDATGSLSGAAGPVSYGFSLARYDTDGVLPVNNGFDNTVFSGNVRMTPNERTRLGLTTRIGRREYHFPTDGAGNVVDENAFTFGDETSVAFDVTRRLSRRFDLRARVSTYELESGTDDRMDGPADTLGFFGFVSLNTMRRSDAEVQVDMALGGGTVGTVGVELENQSQRTFSESSSEYGPSTSRSDNARWNRGGFVHVVSDFGPLSANGGVRLEDNENFGRFVTWHAGLSLAWASTGRLRASAGRAIKEPTFIENFSTGFALGNPELDPERSFSWEVGVEQGLFRDRLVLQATWFDQRFRDLIQYTYAPAQPGDPNFFNVARANARGVEGSADFRVGSVTAGAEVTWLDTEVVDAGFDEGPGAIFVAGEALLRRPELTWGGSLGWGFTDRVRLRLRALRAGERSDRDFSTFPADAVVLDAYTLISFGGDVTLVEPGAGRPGFDVTVRGENLLDERYHEVFGFAAPGRGLYLGGRLTFGAR